MSHVEQRRFVETVAEHLPQFFVGTRVLEIGALDVNGSARQFFSNCDYTGLDVAPGPGVDVVCGGHEYDAPDGAFDVVISFEVMEHNPYWAGTVANMLRVCRNGGLVLISCASVGRAEHGTPRSDPGSSPPTIELGWDHYENIREAALRGTVSNTRQPLLAAYWTNWRCHDLYMAALKGAPSGEMHAKFAAMIGAVDSMVRRDNRTFRAIGKRLLLLKKPGEGLLTSMRRFRRWVELDG